MGKNGVGKPTLSPIIMEVENHPKWKETNIGDTPIFHWTMIMGGRVTLTSGQIQLAIISPTLIHQQFGKTFDPCLVSPKEEPPNNKKSKSWNWHRSLSLVPTKWLITSHIRSLSSCDILDGKCSSMAGRGCTGKAESNLLQLSCVDKIFVVTR